ncbi:Hymenoptaecin, partial [Habropoda laboriosa]
GSPRVRRQDRGSLVIHGEKPMSGPDRRPSLDVDYHQRVLDRNGMTANTYGGLNIRPGQPPQPHAGIQLQRNFKDGFIGGFGQVQRRPGGGPSPTFGISGGYRFRRDVDEPVDDEIAPQY